MLTLSTADIKAIEQATRTQHNCKPWHEERYGRLTSSGFGEIVKCRQYGGHAQRKIYPNFQVDPSNGKSTMNPLLGV